MSKFWSRFVHDLVPYTPGEQPKIANIVKLNTNENPYGPSPKALAAMQAAVNDDLRLYPDPNSDCLKQAIADFYAIDVATVFVGNSSDEVLAHVFNALLQHERPLLFPDISYSFYPVYSGLYGIDYKAMPLADDFSIQLADYVQANGGIIFPNPNAPTGIALSLEQIESLLQSNTESVVVVDEAYIDFGGQTAITLVEKYPNLVVTQTFSKSRSLAGLRVGFAIAQPALIEALERIKNSFNSYPLDRVALAGASAAMADKEWFDKTRKQVIANREVVSQRLVELGFQVLPSAANFVFTQHKNHDAAALALALRERGIIVRHFKQERIEQFLRISIGTEEENQALLKALTEILGK